MTMIPVFPIFRQLEIGDRAAIEAITRRFAPYSDFGFTSLWAWDTDETCTLSMLHGNLVVRFKDYTANAHFYSFIGQDAVAETVETLLALARQEGLPSQLKLVPEAVIAADDRLRRNFSVAEDRDNFDYLYAADDWAHFPAPHFQDHLKNLERRQRREKLDFRLLDLGNPCCQNAILALFGHWARQKQLGAVEDSCQELTAMQRLFALPDDDQIAACGCYHGERLVGFSIWEALEGDEYVVGHFQKTDRAYRGLSSWLAHMLSQHLEREGRCLINGQQDLGIPGLRAHKMSLRPRTFLRKYVIAEDGARSEREQ